MGPFGISELTSWARTFLDWANILKIYSLVLNENEKKT